MLINKDTVISLPSSSLVLVPYESAHVPQYHKWMQSSDLLELTASEPLSLEEEYENMRSWREDSQKLTFIILDGSLSPIAMVGDVNLYLLENTEENEKVAEIEVMIAEEKSRRKGLAYSALQVMMAYASKNLAIQIFVAKILEHNSASIKLFEDKLGFKLERKVKAFKEVHFKQVVDQELSSKLEAVRRQWDVSSYGDSSFRKQFHS